MKTIAFVGSQEIGVECLNALIYEGQKRVIGVLPMHPHKHELWTDQVSSIARSNGIPILRDTAQLYNADIAIVAGWRHMIDPSHLPPGGGFALHASLLPKYRGWAPINWAIINGERETGVTLFKMTEQVDAGPIVAQSVIPILEQDTASTIRRVVAIVASNLLLLHTHSLLDGTAPLRQQNEADAHYGSPRHPKDGWFSLEWDSQRIINWVRALTRPYPGAMVNYNNNVLVWGCDEEAIRVWACRRYDKRADDVDAWGRNIIKAGDGKLIEITDWEPL